MSELDETAKAARRTGIIFVSILLSALALTAAWMIPEARRISRNRETRLNEARLGSDMVRVSAGAFTMGANDGAPNEQPLHDVRVSGFWMDRSEVTNDEFARFVKATNYVTTAERPPVGVVGGVLPPGQDEPGSWCFRPSENAKAVERRTWIAFVPGANWRQPQGPGSSIEGRGKFPVVHVSYEDAIAYCKWTGKRLPTEAEWECAARGGMLLTRYPWGKEFDERGAAPANTWQGTFPVKDEAVDGFAGLAPAGRFGANSFGLQDLAGNVAEWCADWYQHDFYAQLSPDPNRAAHRNPKGPEVSTDPTEPGVWKRVVRGGSWLSDAMGCRVSARDREAPGFSAEWLGFRCVKDDQ